MGDTKTTDNSLSHMVNSVSQVSTVKLDGAGTYLAWSRSCLLFIKSRKLLSYITGEKKAPVVTDANYSQWDSDNSLVMTWLLNTMHPRISKQYLLLDTAEKIWNSTKRTYSRKGNDAQVFEIRNKIHATKQGELTITDYYSELTGLWQEIDYYQDLQAKCSDDAVLFQKLVEKERIYDFLAGLNPEYDQIRVQVLGKVPFPSLEDAYSYVQQEESRRGVMLYSTPTEKSGLAVSHEQTKAFTSDKDHLHCDYCGRSRHTKETCWKLHGRPTRGRGGKRVGLSRGQAHIAENVGTFGENASGEALSSEEVQHLRRLLNKLDTSNVGSSNYVQSGIAFNAHLNSWIIDSGANRHMTGSSKGFQNYSPSPKGDCVRIANGSLTPVSGTGSVICTPDITLSSVLHVPEFPVNLLSVNAITKQLKCSVEFFPDYCVFQDLQTRKRIGSGRLHDDLYWIDGTRAFGQAFFGGNKSINQEIYSGIDDVEFHEWMSTDKCVSMLVEVNPCSDRVGSLVVAGLLNDSKKSDETWKVSQTLRFQEYPPGVKVIPMESRTAKPFRTTNLIVFLPGGNDSGCDDSFVAHGEALIVDPGCKSASYEQLKEIIAALPRKLVVFVTHHHNDHVDGLSIVQKYSPDACLLAHENTIRRIRKDDWSLPCVPVSGSEEICIGSQRLRVIFAPGHTDGHMGLLHVNTNSLIVGDHCVGITLRQHTNSLSSLLML